MTEARQVGRNGRPQEGWEQVFAPTDGKLGHRDWPWNEHLESQDGCGGAIR
jgi:hypothetical protein